MHQPKVDILTNIKNHQPKGRRERERERESIIGRMDESKLNRTKWIKRIELD